MTCLYDPNEYLFIGNDTTTGAIGRSIRKAGEWIDFFRRRGGCPFPKIIPNPLTGEPGVTKDGKQSFRADSCIESFRFLVAEFDGISLEEQFAFWMGCPKLPVAALIHSGKKSLHA